MGWLKPTKVIAEWIIQINDFLRPYDSYHIYTGGPYKRSSYERSSQFYDDIILADNGPAHPDRISAGASIIIAPKSNNTRHCYAYI